MIIDRLTSELLQCQRIPTEPVTDYTSLRRMNWVKDIDGSRMSCDYIALELFDNINAL